MNKENLPENYGTTTIFTFQGKPLTAKVIASLSPEEKQLAEDEIFQYFRKYGFPYPKYSEEDLKDDWKNIIRLNPHNLLDDCKNITDFSRTGGKLIKHFQPGFFDVAKPNKNSLLTAFNDDSLLRKTIKNRLEIQFNITGNMLRQGLRNSFVASATSYFPIGVAKLFYQLYVPDNGTVFDCSSGFGQRALAAMACHRGINYIGTEPWVEAHSGIISMVNWIQKYDKTSCQVYNQGSEIPVPEKHNQTADLMFSSPPYYNKEIYSSSETQAYHNRTREEFFAKWWRPTMVNIKKVLKPTGKIILNVSDDLINDFIKVAEEFGFKEIDGYNFILNRNNIYLNKKTGNYEPIVVLSQK